MDVFVKILETLWSVVQTILCIPIIILLSLTTYCSSPADRSYTCEIENVESVQIVRLGEDLDEEYRREYTILCEISDKAEFIERLTSIKHHAKKGYGDPSVMAAGYIVIKIDLTNGDYDLIHHNVQIFRRDGVNNSGNFSFDESDFNSLLDDYLIE